MARGLGLSRFHSQQNAGILDPAVRWIPRCHRLRRTMDRKLKELYVIVFILTLITGYYTLIKYILHLWQTYSQNITCQNTIRTCVKWDTNNKKKVRKSSFYFSNVDCKANRTRIALEFGIDCFIVYWIAFL